MKYLAKRLFLYCWVPGEHGSILRVPHRLAKGALSFRPQ